MIYTREDIINYTEDLLDPSNEEISAAEDLDVRLKTLDYFDSATDAKIQAAAGQFSGFALKTVDGGVDAATTTNQTLSGIRDLGTDRKVIGTDGLRVLVAGQTNKADNGLYLMKSGAWQRMTGYTSGVSLSGLMVGVNGGDNIGLFIQPNQLANMQAEKPFQKIVDLSSAVQAAAGANKEEVRDETTSIIASEPDEEGNITVEYNYQVGNLVNGAQLRRVKWQQTDYGDRTLKRSAWSYNAGTGVLSIDSTQETLPDAGSLLLELVTYGTYGASSGIDLKIDGNQFVYRLGEESNADYKNAGAIPVVGGGPTGVYNVTTPVSDGQIYTHTYNTKDIDIKVKDTQGRTDTVIYATPIDNNSFRLNIPENETFTGKLLLSVYPETLS